MLGRMGFPVVRNSFILTKETSVERYMVGTYWSEKRLKLSYD